MDATSTILVLYLCFIAGSALVAAMSYREKKQKNGSHRNFINHAVKEDDSKSP